MSKKMKYDVAYSVAENEETAVAEVKSKIGDENPALLIFFTSRKFDADKLNTAIDSEFGDIPYMGCTTAGELVTGKMLEGSLSVMTFSSEVIEDVKIESVDLTSGVDSGINKAFSGFNDHYQIDPSEMDFEKYVGLMLVDGLNGLEEEINDKIGNKTSISFVGGSAGDDFNFKATYVFANNYYGTNGAVLAVVKPRGKFRVLKTQSFGVTDKTMVPTKVNKKERKVIEFNNKPATEAYAEVLGIKEEEVENYFFENPVGLVFDPENPFVRSPQSALDNQAISFYCGVDEGVELSLLKQKDIIEQTKKDLDKDFNENGTPSAIINFNCILRKAGLEKNDQKEEFGALYKDIPTIGFNTYGESLLAHMNQTSTMLLLD